jgi:hypothetical protein
MQNKAAAFLNKLMGKPIGVNGRHYQGRIIRYLRNPGHNHARNLLSADLNLFQYKYVSDILKSTAMLGTRMGPVDFLFEIF